MVASPIGRIVVLTDGALLDPPIPSSLLSLVPLILILILTRIVPAALLPPAAHFPSGRGATPWPRLSDVGGEKETRSDPSLFGESKLLASLWAGELQAKLRSSPAGARVAVVCVHPGSVATEMITTVDTSAARAARSAAGGRAPVGCDPPAADLVSYMTP